MPTATRASMPETDHGPVVERSSELGPYTVDIVSFRQDMDMAEMYAPLPGGRCDCPHWGTLLKGRMVVHYEDHDEVIEAGDQYYMSPGHVPEITAGTEFVMFSPTDGMAATNAAIQAAMQAG
jgi:hypothetical protein